MSVWQLLLVMVAGAFAICGLLALLLPDSASTLVAAAIGMSTGWTLSVIVLTSRNRVRRADTALMAENTRRINELRHRF